MPTSIEDLQFVEQDAAYVAMQYGTRDSLNFYGSQKLWDGLSENIDARLSVEKTVAPVLLMWRAVYDDVLCLRPDTAEGCKRALDDMQVTARNIRGLDEIASLSTRSNRASATKKMWLSGEVQAKHLSSIVNLEQRSVEDWNTKRLTKKQLKPQDRAFFEKLMECVATGDEVIFKRMFERGSGDTLGFFAMRDDVDGQKNPEQKLFSFAAEKDPGIAEALCARILQSVGTATRYRMVNAVAESHFKA